MNGKIQEIDRNFTPPVGAPDDIVYYNVLEPQFIIDGLVDPRTTQGEFCRIPKEVAEKCNTSVPYLSIYTTGGRIRFATNSSCVVFKVELIGDTFLGHMPASGMSGIDIYSASYGSKISEQRRCGSIFPRQVGIVEYDGIKNFSDNIPHDITVNLPLYNGIKSMIIGIKKDSTFLSPTDYVIKKPVLYYGSSITQGGCVSRPGNAYPAILGRMLDCNYICLGLSGSAKGEQALAEYIASLDLSAFVYDYDHNAPTFEHLKETHFSFFETIRKIKPHLPIIMVSKPDFDEHADAGSRRDLILENYLKAKKAGDSNVYFIDGEMLFGCYNRDDCTVDGCHPNDLGFFRMAETIYPKLKKALSNKM